MAYKRIRYSTGFANKRLIEALLGALTVSAVVFAITVGLTASKSINEYDDVQSRARDAQRNNDIHAIKRMLEAYNGFDIGVVTPGAPGYEVSDEASGFEGHNISRNLSWMAFLREDGKRHIPVDPVNKIKDLSDFNASSNRFYAYKCFDSGHEMALPNSATAFLSYRNEPSKLVEEKLKVNSCLSSIPH